MLPFVTAFRLERIVGNTVNKSPYVESGKAVRRNLSAASVTAERGRVARSQVLAPRQASNEFCQQRKTNQSD